MRLADKLISISFFGFGLRTFEHMTTIRLNISDKVLDKVLGLLSRFAKEDVEVIKEDAEYQNNKKKIEAVIHRIDSGEEKLLSQDELDSRLDQVLSKYDH